MVGDHCRLERLDGERHSQALYEAYALDAEGAGWTYLPYGPWTDQRACRAWVEEVAPGQDPQFWAVLSGSRQAVGVTSFLRTDRANGVVEVGHIHYSQALQRTPASTEAMYVMMRRVFEELGYRRYEWKCDAMNAPSRAAAARLGFQYEGTFRQAAVVNGRNRDTAWFSVIDTQWPALSAAFTSWLDPGNFDAEGRQRRTLADLRASR
jgi:RimJ/RimL family protein N-acetyltransferase